MSGISFNPNISISVDTARTVYGVTAEDLKTLNSDGNDKITLKELLISINPFSAVWISI